MTPKDQFRYSVLSAIHDEALSISDAIDQAYGEHVAGEDAEIERVFEKFYLGASRLSIRRMAARSMKASEVWTFNS